MKLFLLGALVLVVALVWFANRSVFFPLKYPQGEWGVQAALGAQDIGLVGWDGVNLHGWWVEPPTPRVVTLFFHGNAGNVTHRAAALAALRQAGSAVLLMDYRGYGKSQGTPVENNLYKDAETAYDLLITRGYDPNRLVIHGESLGTAVAVDLATKRRCAGIVLEAPFPSVRAVARDVLPVIGPLLVWGFDTKKKIAGVQKPLLIIHGDSDDIIRQPLGREVFDAAPGPKEFWSVPGAGHNNLVVAAGSSYVRKLSEFYARVAR